MVEPVAARDWLHEAEVGETAEAPRDVRGLALRQERRVADAEGLSNDGRPLEEIALDRGQLVQTSCDGAVHGDWQILVWRPGRPGQLDDEQGIALRAVRRVLVGGAGAASEDPRGGRVEGLELDHHTFAGPQVRALRELGTRGHEREQWRTLPGSDPVDQAE